MGRKYVIITITITTTITITISRFAITTISITMLMEESYVYTTVYTHTVRYTRRKAVMSAAVYPNGIEAPQQQAFKVDSLRGSSVEFGTIQRILSWPLRKGDTHKSRSVNISFIITIIIVIIIDRRLTATGRRPRCTNIILHYI